MTLTPPSPPPQKKKKQHAQIGTFFVVVVVVFVFFVCLFSGSTPHWHTDTQKNEPANDHQHEPRCGAHDVMTYKSLPP